MTAFVGAFCLAKDGAIPLNLKVALRRSLRLFGNRSGSLQEYDRSYFFLIKWDSGAFGEHAWTEFPDHSVCTLSGDPLLLTCGRREIRQKQLERLVPDGNGLSLSSLADTRGSFAFLQFSVPERTLRLATDCIGMRPIYYTIQENLLIFSTSLNTLETTPQICKAFSLQGVAEASVFGYPLQNRTPYQNIKVLREAETLAANHHGVDLTHYYNWSAIENHPRDQTESVKWLYECFKDAVRIRAGNDQSVYAFLSGGMDSRAIVATLIALGHHVEALNFSPDGSQDQHYARLFADAARGRCRIHCASRADDPNFSLLAYAAKTQLESDAPMMVERPKMIWSGDGGSVGLGHVYMDQKMIDLAKGGDILSAVKHLLHVNHNVFPARILSQNFRDQISKHIIYSVLDEVNRYQRPDVGRQLYLYLLFNDQRRHLFKHFETIRVHGLEFLTPFFDTKFLRAIAATPVEWGLFHRLYSIWFDELPTFALETPWQTYPGHVACPIPCDLKLSYQWANRKGRYNGNWGERFSLSKQVLQLLSHGLPAEVFSPMRIITASVLHTLGARDCRHILSTLKTFARYADICSTTQSS